MPVYTGSLSRDHAVVTTSWDLTPANKGVELVIEFLADRGMRNSHPREVALEAIRQLTELVASSQEEEWL